MQQAVTGDRNQVIGQVSGGIVINQLTIHERVPATVVPPTVAAAPPLTQQEYRQRQVLLNKVKDYWIEGVLRTSLHARAMIELGLHARPDLVQRPFQDIAEFPNIVAQSLPDGTSATTTFDQMGQGRTLLILGEPGSGKTVTLLKLAEDLIARTENDINQPVPVVFNLSSWARKPQPIEKWLVQELLEKYHVPQALGQKWVETESLILLLDGLDEVKAEQRNACVQALNQFMQTHGTTECTVCCRIKDYQALAEMLLLRSAICIQPLTPEQIDRYVDQAGNQLSALKTALHQHRELQELASSPLMLSIMSLAYQGCSSAEIVQADTSKHYLQRLFDVYIDRMFQRRGTTQQYSRQKTQHWLIWLAQYMLKTSQTEFFIEQLQPDSLTGFWRKTSFKLARCLAVSWLGFYLPKFIAPGILIAGLLFLHQHQNYLLQGKTYEPTVTFIFAGIFIAACFSAISDFFENIENLRIKPVENIAWNWNRVRQSSLNQFRDIMFLFIREPKASVLLLFTGLVFIVVPVQFIYLFITSLVSGLYVPDPRPKAIANQGIWNSRKNSFLGILFGFAISETLIFMTNIWINWLLSPLRLKIDLPELLLGLSPFSHFILTVLAGLVCWSIYGGSACTQHLILRVFLTLDGSIPWNYASFLNNSTDRLFLQKVGGGYIFVHRMLLEHFAAMPLEQEKR